MQRTPLVTCLQQKSAHLKQNNENITSNMDPIGVQMMVSQWIRRDTWSVITWVPDRSCNRNEARQYIYRALVCQQKIEAFRNLVLLPSCSPNCDIQTCVIDVRFVLTEKHKRNTQSNFQGGRPKLLSRG